MPVFNNILAGSSGQSTGYDIEQSLRFEDGDDPVLSRTPASAGNRKTYTVSAWVKRGNLALTYPGIFSGGTGSDVDLMRFNSDDTFGYRASASYEVTSTAVFRDPSAWYHCMMVVDTTQSTEADRVKLYINGEQITALATTNYPAENFEGSINNTVIHYIGTGDPDSPTTRNWDGYLAEVHFIDGTALDASSFGETDADTNQWKPVSYSGSYGTNGFYQKYGGVPETTTSFTTVESTTWTAPAGVTSVEYLVVAGGGGGGINRGGGGGAGGYLAGTLSVTPSTSYTVTVGDGGTGSSSDQGGDGEDSVFSSITATGGGGGGYSAGTPNGRAGGSGGGGGGVSSGGAGTTGQGNDGGGGDHSYSSGGGGGANAAGVAGSGSTAGAGGAGLANSISGSSVTYAGGGGGGTYQGTAGSGGAGGGGNGGGAGAGSGVGSPGTDGLGGGGGGAGYGATGGNGGNGGSGIVIIKYGTSFGNDYSGNDNDFTVTNLVATDQVIDTPTNNYCTLNPLDKSGGTLLEGNLKIDGSTTWIEGRSTQAFSSGKWYFEVYVVNSDAFGVGLRETGYRLFNGLYWSSASFAAATYGTVYGYKRNGSTNYKVTNTTSPVISGSVAAGDILGFEVDLDSATTTLKWNQNGVAQTTLFSSLLALEYAIGWEVYDSDLIFNFGQDSSFAGNKTAQGNGGDGEDFYYTPPTGFKALNTDNLSDPAIALPTDHFNTVLYTGTGATQSITGVGFQPDFTWLKHRNSGVAYSHQLFDSVRTATKYLVSNSTAAEVTDATTLTSFDSDGFSLGTNVGINQNTINHVGWNWKAGGTAASNTDGTITSSVSANADAGFSIVSWTGNGTDGATVGHGLSEQPEILIVKNRDQNWSWRVRTPQCDNDSKVLTLNLNLGLITLGSGTQAWDLSSNTASVFGLGDYGDVNNSADAMLAYCFHSVEGYSKVGSYEGNGNADGTFVYCGFKPAFVMWKSTSASESWQIKDNKRLGYNVANETLFPNNTAVEYTTAYADLVSNGFKLRNAGGGSNGSSESLIYYAIAESPFKTSNAR